MHKSLRLLAVLLLVAAAAHADTYVKQRAHTDQYRSGGVLIPARDSENEFWLGGNRLMFSTETRIVIMDKDANTLIFANKSDSTYAQTALPLDWTAFVPEDFAARLARLETTGTVEKTNETRMIEGFHCTAYRIHAYIPSQGKKLNQQKITLWATNDLPRATRTFRALAHDIFRLRNYREDFITELMKIEGFQIYEETATHGQDASVTSTQTTVEVSEKEAPAGVYALPEWFRKKERLSRRDLQED